jgi:hypothetical protein
MKDERYAQIDGVFGVRRLGAALVVHFESAALIVEKA